MDDITAQNYIDQLTAKGEILFTREKMSQVLSITAKAAERAIYRLKHKKEITMIARGCYLILTPEFRELGCLPPDYFIDALMKHWQKPYYVALLSAALYFGAAHQQPQVFQVITNRYHSPIRCGRVKIEFILKKNMDTTTTTQLNTRTGFMTVSTPESTMMDLCIFLLRSGGINNVATVINELTETVNPTNLKQLLEKNKEHTWMQRLGYLLENLGHTELSEVIYQHIKDQKIHIVPLVPYSSMTGAKRNEKWRVAINTSVESDVHDTH